MLRVSTPPPTVNSARRAVLHRRLRLIVALTIGYNLVEAAISLTAGAAASSTALIGFGLDSLIEVLSAAAIAWQFTRREPERWERPTLRVVAMSFFAMATYVGVSAVLSLAGVITPEHSVVGIVITSVSVVLMPGFSLIELRTGRELGSASAVADSRQTLLCAYLSAAVLVGLVLHAVFGWSWADPVGGLIVAALAIREGIEAWQGDSCAAPVGRLLTGDDEDGKPGPDGSGTCGGSDGCC